VSYCLLISEEAKLDILEAFVWYEAQRDGLGFDFELCVEASLSSIQRYPEAVQIRYDQVYVHFIERFPYGIHYTVDKDIISVFAVFHTSRDPERWNERIEK
jgi:toxin ParE1/3/4